MVMRKQKRINALALVSKTKMGLKFLKALLEDVPLLSNQNKRYG